MKPMLLRALAPLLFSAIPFVALSQDVPLTVKMDGAVALQAATLAEGTLNEAQVQVLKDVAYQKAIVLTCEGFVVDAARFSSIFEAAYPTDAEFDALDEAGQIHLRSVMMLVLGTFLGGDLAIASTDSEAWCASAAEEKARPDAQNRIWAD
jgi:hypothetical protein